MRTILMAGAILALSACGGGGEAGSEANGANMMTADNMMLDQNMMMDPSLSVNGMTTMDANMSGGANAQDMMAADANTNDPDTNLANGI